MRYIGSGRYYLTNQVRAIVAVRTTSYYRAGSLQELPDCRGAKSHEDRRPGPRWRGRHALVSPDRRALEAGAAVRERLPHRGLRAEQPGELQDLDDLRARAVQARLAHAPHRRRVGTVVRCAGQ